MHKNEISIIKLKMRKKNILNITIKKIAIYEIK